ncbi:uncharacterized protein JCM10292_002484 [Rhodotorula paludigena]|uniref:uncharacterized protein n=1 Tax=Rhodotorula paludigena TaxID=86838 RepID=UPI00317F12C9
MDAEKAAVEQPQPLPRSYTAPGRPQAGDETAAYARSLSMAETGQPTGGVIPDASLVAEPQEIVEDGVPSTMVGGAGGGQRLRQRRPAAARATTAPPLGRNGEARQDSKEGGQERSGSRPLIGMHLLEPKIPVATAPGWRSSLMNIVKYSWLNVLLVFVPVSWACHFTDQSPTVTFIMSFIAIVPLAALLGFATEDIALRVGETIGGLLNATFGNAVELIIAILALVKGELDIVQSSMIGSILSNCLLVLGMCYFAGGLKRHEMAYGVRPAQVNLNLLGLAVTAIVIPVAFHSFVDDAATESLDVTNAKVLEISHGVAIILLVVYLASLVFQLWTHAYMYAPPPKPDPSNPNAMPPMASLAPSNYPGEPQPPTEGGVFRIPSLPSLPSWGSSSDDGSSSSSSSSSSATDPELEHTPKMLARVAMLLLVVVTVITGVTAEWLVSSIEGLVETGGVSEQFVALILLPLVGNAAEHVTAVTVATKNKLDLSMSVAIGSSIQIALFVIPILILLGWCIGQPLTFYFDEFETLVLFISVVGVNWAIADGRTNWLEGLVLMVIYVIIALVFWYYDPTGASLS